jgi:ketosteroid isomerase-like protein
MAAEIAGARGRNDFCQPAVCPHLHEMTEAMMIEEDPAKVARASYDAYVSKDRAAIEALIADDFHFTSPLDNRLDRATYFTRCWPNSAAIAGFEFIHVARGGERVFVTYEGRNAEGKRFRNTEILTIRNGKICEAEVYFGWSIPHPAAPGGFVDAAAS